MTKPARALIVYAHPNSQSFNHALLETTIQGLKAAKMEVRVRDLYAEGFDPVLSASDIISTKQGKIPEDIAREQAELIWATHLVLIYPIWWGDRPAILKGWFDRIFHYGFAHKGGQGLLVQEKALVLQTTGEPAAYYGAAEKIPYFHPTITEGTLHYCGIKDVHVHTFYAVPVVGKEQRQEMLEETGRIIAGWI